MRRNFIATGTAMAMVPGLPGGQDGATDGWVVRVGRAAYRVRLQGAVLVCDCLSHDGTEPVTPPPAPPMLTVGPDHRPVRWQLGQARHPSAAELVLVLTARDDPCQAELRITLDPASLILSIATVVRHTGDDADIAISRSNSANLIIDTQDAEIVYLTGAWGRETQLQRGHRAHAPLALESRDGKTGFGAQPYLALRAARATYVCQLLWSGNWELNTVAGADSVLISAGLNNWRFGHVLRPGASLVLPMMLFGRIAGDLNAATQHLHDYRRQHRPNPDRIMPVQFNSWYPYQGEPTAEAMLAVLPTARRLGCEAFVVDAGWFRAEDSDTDASWEARTGDWRTSRRRFPHGLLEISDACRDLGLGFGLWIEPEVIGTLSAIRRIYPTWLHHIDGKPPRDDARAVLNLGLASARQHVFDRISALVSALGLRWLKWDFNADLGAGGWAPGLPPRLTGQDPLVAHYAGLYRLLDSIRAAFPNLIVEMCASGGGRMDGAILSHAHLNWISDQPGALRKLAIHFGSQLAHPAVVCNDWLVEWPPGSIAGYDDELGVVDRRGDLPFRLRVAMLGSFGISARADLWPEADITVVIAHVSLYKTRLRAIIHHGDQYLLTHAPEADGSGDWAVIWYASKDQSAGVLFAFRLAGADRRDIRLPGLTDGGRYRVTPFAGVSVDTDGTALAAGLTVVIDQPYHSALYLIDAIPA